MKTSPPETSSNDNRLVTLEVIIALGFYLLVRYIGNLYEFAPFGTIFKSGNLSVILTAMGFLGYLKLKNRNISEIGVGRPDSWIRLILVTMATILTVAVVANMVSPILENSFEPNPSAGSRFHEIEGNTLYFIITTVTMAWFAAAFCEEILFRGILLIHFKKVFGSSVISTASILILQAVVFGLVHIYQGWAGAIMAGLIGLILGFSTIWSKGMLWPAVITHAIPDTMTLFSIYSS